MMSLRFGPPVDVLPLPIDRANLERFGLAPTSARESQQNRIYRIVYTFLDITQVTKVLEAVTVGEIQPDSPGSRWALE